MTQQVKGGYESVQREYRAAVVFYGGVSLAIYENGVARAFHEAVCKRSVFAPLLELLGGRFVVDVISGSSAGGINGLLLAAALEGGARFATTADLWRQAGALDALLRDPDEKNPLSLLKGESYYINQLRGAFRELLGGDDRRESLQDLCPKEIDVYVTGTDLSGQVDEFVDGAGSKIQTKKHNLVFHLKHRRGRARLGIDALDDSTLQSVGDSQTALQADILASVSRITSSFPGAFPPFTCAELSKNPRPDAVRNTPQLVRTALQRTSRSPLKEGDPDDEDFSKDHPLIDGGVLDNKPFEPVLDAIFERMPNDLGSAVDRSLFYVEPDPVRFQTALEFSPLAVAVNSIVTLPMYDTIASDVDRLDRHNAQVAQFRSARQRVRANPPTRGAAPGDAATLSYLLAVQRSIGCMLVGTSPSEVEASHGLDEVLEKLPAICQRASFEHQRDVDLGFHLRRAYDTLYAVPHGGAAVHGTNNPRYEVGRVIKGFKLLRDVWLRVVANYQRTHEDHPLSRQALRECRKGRRDKHLAPEMDAQLDRAVRQRYALLQTYLSAAWLAPDELDSFQDGVATQLTSAHFTDLARKASSWLKDQLSESTTPHDDSLAAVHWLNSILAVSVPPEQKQHLEQFADIDIAIYPAELSAGLYELDEVEIVRISPGDAKLPPNIDAADKITGDLLGHFSAFLRSDWRTNDIAWGHSDGLCQIIQTLLSPAAWAIIAERLADAQVADALATQFETETLLKHLKEGLPGDVTGLREACGRVTAAFAAVRNAPHDVANRNEFRKALIGAGQIAAMGEYVDKLAHDSKVQNAYWRWKEGPERLPEPGRDPLNQVKGLKLGGRPISEEVPTSLLVQYVAQAGLLLWGMLGHTFKSSRVVGGLSKRVGAVVQPVLWLVFVISRMMRSERALAAALLLGSVTFLLGVGVAGLRSDSDGQAFFGFGGVVLLAVLVRLLTGRWRHTFIGLLLLVAAVIFTTPIVSNTRETLSGWLSSAAAWVAGDGQGETTEGE